MIITNMERCRGWLPFFERKGKMVRNKANSDSHRMQRSSDYGYLGDVPSNSSSKLSPFDIAQINAK